MFPKWPSGRSKIEPNRLLKLTKIVPFWVKFASKIEPDRLLKLTKIVPFCVKFDNKLKIAAYSSRVPLFWTVLEASETLPGTTMTPQDAPGCNPEAPRHLPDTPRRPKTHRDDPKTPQDAPKTLPRRLQEAILPNVQCQN